MTGPIVSAFTAAGEWFVDIAGRDEVAVRWEEPSALVGYTVGGIVGHTAAAVAWLGPLLHTTTPEGDVPVWSPADYIAPFPVRRPEDLDGPLHVAARAQGQRGAQRGPKETVGRLRTRLDDLAGRLAAEAPGRLVDLRPTLPAAIRLDDFLRTRVVELVVHGDDLASSVALDLKPTPRCGRPRCRRIGRRGGRAARASQGAPGLGSQGALHRRRVPCPLTSRAGPLRPTHRGDSVSQHACA